MPYPCQASAANNKKSAKQLSPLHRGGPLRARPQECAACAGPRAAPDSPSEFQATPFTKRDSNPCSVFIETQTDIPVKDSEQSSAAHAWAWRDFLSIFAVPRAAEPGAGMEDEVMSWEGGGKER